MVAISFDVGEIEVVVCLVEQLRRLRCADRNASARLHFNVEGLMVRRRLRQAVACVRELIDVPHQDIVQLLPPCRLLALHSRLQRNEPEPVALRRVRLSLTPLLHPSMLLILNYLLLQLL